MLNNKISVQYIIQCGIFIITIINLDDDDYALFYGYVTDVTFDEETTLKKSRRCQLEEVHEEDVPPRRTKAEPTPEIVAS